MSGEKHQIKRNDANQRNEIKLFTYVDILNLDIRPRFAIGDMVQQPTMGHIGILLEEEIDKSGFWLVEWFMDPKGRILKKRLQTYEYDKSLKLYAKAQEA